VVEEKSTARLDRPLLRGGLLEAALTRGMNGTWATTSPRRQDRPQRSRCASKKKAELAVRGEFT